MAHPAQGNACFFYLLAGLLNQLLAALLRQWWHWHTDDVTIVAGVEAKRLIGSDGAGNLLQISWVKWRDLQQRCLRCRHVSHLVERHTGAIRLDHNAIKHTRVSPAGADLPQALL